MRVLAVVFTALLTFSATTLLAQTNTSVTTATEVTSWPTTFTNISSVGGGTAVGMGGSCNTLACCSVIVYKWTIPVRGSIRIEMTPYDPIGNSLITYKAAVPNPQDWTDLTYVPSPGNFCGFRDTCQIGRAYDWHPHGGTGWAADTLPIYEPTIPAGTYYTLVFTENNQTSQGLGTNHDITFDYRPYCPDGYNCGSVSEIICSGGTYTAPSGAMYSTSGSYQDTLPGAAAGGIDSLVFISLTFIGDSMYSDTTMADTTLACGANYDAVASTEMVSYGTFNNSNNDHVEVDDLADSLAGSNRSVFMWVQTQSNVNSSNDALFAINKSNGDNVSIFWLDTNEKLSINHGSSNVDGNTVVTNSGWHFVGLTYDETSTETNIWVDGVLDKTFTNSQTCSATDQITIGAEYDGGSLGNYLKGDLAEVTVWTEVLDSAAVQHLMAHGPNSTHANINDLLAYYPFGSTACPTTNGVLEDFSGNGYHGTVSATTIFDPVSVEQIPGCNGAPGFDLVWSSSASGALGMSDNVTITPADAGTITLELSRSGVVLNQTFDVNAGIDLSVTQSGSDALKVNQAGATYQWLDCDNNYATVANTTDSINANDGFNGNYAVEVTYNGCTDTSACYSISAATCAAPGNLRVRNLTHNNARMVWDVVGGASAYRVWYKPIGTGGWVKVMKNGNQGRRDVSGLLPSTTYRWMVQARCSGTWGPLSTEGSFTTFDGACTTPDSASLATSPVQETQARLNWTPTAFTHQYQIQYRVPSGSWAGIIKDATWSKHWLTSLAPNTTYEWRIRSKCKAGNAVTFGEWSHIMQFSTPAATPKSYIEEMQTNADDSRVVLFPNPTRTEVNLRMFPTLLPNTIEVFNMMGQIVHTERLQAGQTAANLQLGYLPSGMYTVRVSGGMHATKRLMIE